MGKALYIVPVECGGKEDVRYLYVSTDDRKVKVTSAGYFHFDIHSYSIGQYDNAAYENELGTSDSVFLHIYYKHAGLGVDNGWTKNIHDETIYHLRKKRFLNPFKLIRKTIKMLQKRLIKRKGTIPINRNAK